MIRLAHEEDLHNITKIYNDAILNTTAVYSYDPVTLENRQAWFAQKLAKNEPVLVYVKDNEVVGFATYGSFRDWPAYKNTVEHSIYVDPKTRKEGIASKLLTELIKEIEYKGYKTIVAGIDANNEGSIKLHEKFNFVACGNIKSVGYKFDKWLDLAFYQLILK
ncbi:N-acetyltransferase family protein [Staphylococcus arlettae]|uniref:GNAT family N-acetyltransferase n=1 Tax=Staphylococcus TaxID=1279 RepID=UPI0019508C56|nr:MULTISPECIES: GNAT family N-acetyltransferase [Staphylococcus]MCD8815271.1 GNAT family N-acetyltransferase [Staphylococcus arlettae]MCP8714210.1 GNAT family N-acetyltransferase [Staphylococcus arlettae]MDN0188378.1 GNAT family N-acetyltransferase [Staphylococcus arlettae]MDT4051706.1 GNAT family N-acetyltransferase [Staphylococcus arlettae]